MERESDDQIKQRFSNLNQEYEKNNYGPWATSINKAKRLIDDEDKYKGYKVMIETAIQEKNWQTLEELIDSRVKKYPDLINMINEALKERK